MKKILLLLIVSIFAIQDIDAQNPLKGKYRRFSVEIYGGIPYIHGDIKNEFTGYDLASRFNWHATSAVSIGAEVGIGSVKGYDNPMRYFTNNYIKVIAGGEIYLFDLFKMYHVSSWFQPYLGVNVGAIKSDIEKSNNHAHYNYWTWVQHFNGGFKFKLTNMIDLNLSANFMLTGTDRLDNYNVKEPSNKSRDALSTMKLGLTFHVGKKENKSIIWKDESAWKEEMLPVTVVEEEEDDSVAVYTQNKIEELEGKIVALEGKSTELNIKVVSSKNEVGALEEKVGNVEKKTMFIEQQLGGSGSSSSVGSVAIGNNNDANTLYFELGSARLPQAEISKLDNIASYLKANPNDVITVSGHSDKIGEESFNLELSMQRAESVKKQLVKLGVKASRIETYGFGKSYLIPDSDARNRRAVIQVK